MSVKTCGFSFVYNYSQKTYHEVASVRTRGFFLSKPYQPKPFHTKRAHKSSNRLRQLNTGFEPAFIECQAYVCAGSIDCTAGSFRQSASSLCVCGFNVPIVAPRKPPGGQAYVCAGSIAGDNHLSTTVDVKPMCVRVQLRHACRVLPPSSSSLCVCGFNFDRPVKKNQSVVKPMCVRVQ